jgi:hypothetical protein
MRRRRGESNDDLADRRGYLATVHGGTTGEPGDAAGQAHGCFELRRIDASITARCPIVGSRTRIAAPGLR